LDEKEKIAKKKGVSKSFREKLGNPENLNSFEL